MPQPATHYLVTRRAIPKEYWGPWWDKYKPYFGLGSSAPDLFYFPLVPNVTVRNDIEWGDFHCDELKQIYYTLKEEYSLLDKS